MTPAGDEDALLDDALLDDAIRALQREARLSVVLGGHVADAGSMRLRALRGTTTHALRDLHVVHSAGLGGRVLARNRPATVHDYLSSPGISHDYDRPVATEGLRTMLAVPVADGGRVRMVLYGAIRQHESFGERTLRAAMRVADSVGREVGVRAEVQRRMQALAQRDGLRAQQVPPDSAEWDAVRDAHAELRQLAHETADADLGRRIGAVADDLATASAGGSRDDSGGPEVALSPRELDVLACVGVGSTNAETARRLQILPETVKSYLSSAMRKLGARNRHAAATTARRQGLLP